MHFSESYGKPLTRVMDTFVAHDLPDADDWGKGEFQSALNKFGAYVHKFQRQGGTSNFSKAVQNIVAPDGKSVVNQNAIVPTCATYVGPSLCRTYSSGLWKNSAGFVFSPNTRITISYKGDIWTNRLAQTLNPQFHKHVKSQSSWWKNYAAQDTFERACEKYAKKIVKTFDNFGPTNSAFKNRISKQLRLVVSSQYQQYKIAEMEARANCYFKPNAYTKIDGIDIDRPSKYIIYDLLKADHLDVSQLTKDGLILKLEEYIKDKPKLAVFLRSPLIKVSNFSSDQCVQTYLNKAVSVPFVRNFFSSYSCSLDTYRKQATSNNSWDPITALTPNEFQLLPRPDDLVGLMADIRSIASFTECLEAVKKLRENTNTIKPAERLKPFIHTIGYFKSTAYTQLGWSQHITPWSLQGLLEFAVTGKVKSFECNPAKQAHFFVPDMFAIFHRIAARGHLNLSFSNDAEIDLLKVSSTLPDDFSGIGVYEGSSTDKTTLVELAARNRLISHNSQDANKFKEAFKLFCYIDALFLTADARAKKCLKMITDNKVTYEAHQIIVEIYRGSGDQIKSGLSNLMETHLNRLQLKMEASSRHKGYQRELRAGMKDSGKFTYNKDLGCVVLSCGKRSYNQHKYHLGVFTHSDKMREGGSTLSLGIQVEPIHVPSGKALKIGRFDIKEHLSGICINYLDSTGCRSIQFVTKNFEDNLVNIKLNKLGYNRLNLTLEIKSGENIALNFEGFLTPIEQNRENPAISIRLISKGLEKLHHNGGTWISTAATKILLNLAFDVHSVAQVFQESLGFLLEKHPATSINFSNVNDELHALLAENIIPLLRAAFRSNRIDVGEIKKNTVNQNNKDVYNQLNYEFDGCFPSLNAYQESQIDLALDDRSNVAVYDSSGESIKSDLSIPDNTLFSQQAWA